MKHKLAIATIVIMAMVIPSTIMAQGNKPRTSPDKAKYSIVGTMNYRNGERWLDNPVGKRISFEYDENRPAIPTDKADLEVRFDFVRTDHQMTKLDFWRFDSEAGEWIYDSEVRQGDTVAVTKMQTNVMLVIDKSSSLKGDFPKVQEAAIEFVNQLYTASREKGVTFRVGIIAFSTIKFSEKREITTLNATNYNEIVTFIRGLKMENGTALYYSLDKALDMLEKDTRDNIKPDEYRESRIYAFTDGLDQASIDDQRGLTTPTQYYEHLRPLMKGEQRKLIMNMPRKIVRSTMVTVRGDDMTDKQIQLFDERAEQICDNVRKLDDMTKLVKEFKELAADLVNSNFMLYCYIPEGASGLVGWTFAEDNKEKKGSSFWLGVGAEGGYAINLHDYNGRRNYHGNLHLDMAWPISSRFALGLQVSLNMGKDFGQWFCDFYEDREDWYVFDPYIYVGYGFGIQTKFTFRNKSALLFSTGFSSYKSRYYSYSTSRDYWGYDIVDVYYYENEYIPYFRIGYKLISPWYFTASLFINNKHEHDGEYTFVNNILFVGVGYSLFGSK